MPIVVYDLLVANNKLGQGWIIFSFSSLGYQRDGGQAPKCCYNFSLKCQTYLRLKYIESFECGLTKVTNDVVIIGIRQAVKC